MASQDNIVIVGYVNTKKNEGAGKHYLTLISAGIIGLDVALVLAERGYGKQITVIAEYLPGDTAIAYTSPW